jgi:hypothetical protein
MSRSRHRIDEARGMVIVTVLVVLPWVMLVGTAFLIWLLVQ